MKPRRRTSPRRSRYFRTLSRRSWRRAICPWRGPMPMPPLLRSISSRSSTTTLRSIVIRGGHTAGAPGARRTRSWLPCGPTCRGRAEWLRLRSISSAGEPLECGMSDLRRQFVDAVVAHVRDVVPLGDELRDDGVACAVDEQALIVDSVGHEHTRLAAAIRSEHPAGRERDDLLEEIAVGETERQRVGRAVGEP